MVRERLLTVDLTEEVVSLQTLARQGVRSGLRTTEAFNKKQTQQQVSLQTLSSIKALTVRVSATF